MSPFTKYNQLAKQLESQLNQKRSLIRFRVLDASERLTKYPSPFTGNGILPPLDFLIEWSIKIEDKHLAGFQFVTVNIITDTDSADRFILESTIGYISDAILHPDKIRETEVIIPSPSD